MGLKTCVSVKNFFFFFLFPCRPPRPDVTTTTATTTMARHYYCDGRELLNFKFSWIFLCVRCALLWVCECVCVCKRKFHVGGAACCSSRNNQRTFRWPTVYKSNPRTCLKKNTKKKLQFGIFVKKEYNLLETFNSNQLDLFISILLLFNYT